MHMIHKAALVAIGAGAFAERGLCAAGTGAVEPVAVDHRQPRREAAAATSPACSTRASFAT